MKVLFIHCAYKFRGGEDTVVEEEMKLLQSYGVEVELICFSNQRHGLLNFLLLPFNLLSYARVRKAISKLEPDVVHVHNFHFAASPSIFFAIKKAGIPFVVTLHNFRLLCPSATLFHKGKRFLHSLKQRFPWSAVWRGVYRKSQILTFWLSLSTYVHRRLGTWNQPDRYIVLTEHARRFFLQSTWQLSKEKLIVKPNFCSTPKMIKAKGPAYFLYVGRLSEEKGIRMMLGAFVRLGYKLKIAGDGPLRAEVEELGAQYENIEYLGVLSKDDIFVLMHNCTSLVFPSIWFEGMPLTIIEAFTCGSPVIASKLGAMEFMITHQVNGLLFKPGDENDLVEKLQLWYSLTASEIADYRQQARATYEAMYTPEKNAEQLLDIYQTLIPESPIQKVAVA